ncbi:hypothetical protein VOLCADRAFT_106953 [Volvox carteri f. nagariensis]|uniref:Uncharacterized protein n=1 Tax=Volvox carteri f. nagariensis TaxID=3068 RepID=D8UAV6_VOLCA|nr:uncharacterized protein VOLCADRAFT_106953 [Volvox carteri f. nagariensis]EFJ43225.1 hypothetical protein VOLCADRAFT_106953 [Volvox carteri f. nagariensis]|eukprot:XP_002955800.1 hypothetical protein VOLCADRAFT_106953 [Volvox carteri f. nagariensis]
MAVIEALRNRHLVIPEEDAYHAGRSEVSDAEVEAVLKEATPGKAPGLDGIPIELYKVGVPWFGLIVLPPDVQRIVTALAYLPPVEDVDDHPTFQATMETESMRTTKEKVMATAANVAESAEHAVQAIKDNIPIMPEGQTYQPGIEAEMWTKPEVIRESYVGADKLLGRVALITGGDSGIGRSVAVHFAREGADVFIMYLDEHEDAEVTKKLVEGEGRRCVTMAANVRDHKSCCETVERCVRELGKLDILVNNAAIQHYRSSITDIKDEEMEATFETNILGPFYMSMAAVKHLPEGTGCIINTASVTAYAGEAHLLDYSATKGAMIAFTRALSQQLSDKGIRVNAVAPGPIWTPLIPATFPRSAILTWQKQVPMQRAGQPSEVGPCYVFLASADGTYFSGQVLHPNGGLPVNS